MKLSKKLGLLVVSAALLTSSHAFADGFAARMNAERALAAAEAKDAKNTADAKAAQSRSTASVQQAVSPGVSQPVAAPSTSLAPIGSVPVGAMLPSAPSSLAPHQAVGSMLNNLAVTPPPTGSGGCSGGASCLSADAK